MNGIEGLIVVIDRLGRLISDRDGEIADLRHQVEVLRQQLDDSKPTEEAP